MDDISDYFSCDNCSNRDFKRVYNFYVRFHGVNFSDDLIYDKMTEEKYECTQCKKTFSKQDIEAGLSTIRSKRKKA